ncbi:MAG: hypothetical protein HN736_17415 [Anaerolineae bacterium]|jgi:peptide/nickel transport system substrate-binding protein|nr:hypothetical protein [Anaerolineae bacterium]MBT3714085.1 hypothetical protein [Anaerolineae bacterium]MBT4311335.1 hypothetical protein [Anaerolineae bacterium]MBT4456948.1 hypothetical protein [Anaerolineae bacterium]MBT6061774.1 hypothetical protein [Anaerolineae bacterium]
MSRIIKKSFFWILAFSLILSACSLPESGASSTPTTAPFADIEPAPTKIATPAPEVLRTLNICLGHEPNTLYINDNPNPAAMSVLEAIYDGPLDSRNYDYQPVILQKTPSLADGDASIISVPVEEGDWVVDAAGNKIELVQGSRVYPSGCQDTSCIATYKKDSSLRMDQMVVNFSFISDLRWADGAPLTADDSVYAFDLAIASKNPADEFLLSRTESYESADVLTTTWRGLPGYRDNDYMTNFWKPMPYHAWNEFSATELVESDVASRFPLGWGAYVVDEWIPAEVIRLVKNPLYYRADEGFPKSDVINFRFIPDPDLAIAALLDGECDLLDPSIRLDGQVALLQQLDASGQIKFYATEKMSLESLHIGIQPASFDDGIISGNDRPQLLSNPKTRQALALCLDRQQVVDRVLHGLATVPDSYIPNAHPLYTSNIELYSYSSSEGSILLDEIGWKDRDNDPSTPRTALNVADVPTGTSLELDYITTTSIQRRQVSEILAESLRECGVGINLAYLPPEEFYAPGPDGILFGRNFDLAQFAMGTESIAPRCDWFSSASLPNAENDWLGENLSGYSSKKYDEACQKASFTLPNAPSFEQNYRETLSIYAEELPAIPLYPYLRVAASRVNLKGFSLDPSAKTWLWNIEEIVISVIAQEVATNPPPVEKTSTPIPSSSAPTAAPTKTPTKKPSYPNS